MGVSGVPSHDAFPDADPLPHAIHFALRQHPIFARFSDAQFQAVMHLLRTRSLDAGEVLVQQGGLDNNLYIIRRGRAILRKVDARGHDPIREVLGPGRVINEVGFLTHLHNDITVEAATPLKVWYIPGDAFSRLLEQSPEMRAAIEWPRSTIRYVRDLEARDRVKEAKEEERVLWFGRRHVSWLLLRVVPAMLALMVGLALVAFHRLFTFADGLLLAVGVAFCGFGTLSVLWSIVDYLNDYFVVTDRRVIHRERVVLLYDSLNEAPLARIQNVTVIRGNTLAAALNVGDVLIETQGASANVRFDWIAQPNQVGKLIEEAQRQAKAEYAAIQRQQVRNELRQEMGLVLETAANHTPTPPSPQPPKPTTMLAKLSAMWQEALPRVKLKRGGQIVYRKHWLALIRNISLPLLALGIYAAAVVFVISLGWLPSQVLVNLLVALVGFAIVLRCVWQYEDWRNDLYILTEEKVIEYKRSPFGLLGDKQKTALLVNVQNITATTKGMLDVLFNVGDVSIRTAGQENELLFARVYDPRGVQREIAQHMEQAQAKRAREEAARRRREFIEWIGIYDELTRIHHNRPPLL